MSLQTKHFYEFGGFRLDPSERVLLCDDQPLALAPKVFDTLLILVENHGHIVEREALMNRVWADSFVEEGNLTYTISILRKILAATPEGANCIETVPKRGYRFKALVQKIEDRPTRIVFEKHTVANVTIAESEDNDSARPMINLATTLAAPLLAATTPEKNFSRRRWLAVAALLTVSALCIAVWLILKPPPKTDGAIKTIAVLPFKVVGAENHDDYLELGMADALITHLSNARQIFVRPTSAVHRYLEQAPTPATVGRELQVEAVLEGSVQKIDDRIRITVRLLKVQDQQPLWGATFDEKFTSIFAVQDSIAQQVTRALEVQLSADEKRRFVRRYTDNPEAYQAYLRGRFYWSKWSRESLQKAIESFKQALAIDAKYALAYTGIADSYAVMGYLNFLPPTEAYPKSKEAALQAVELDNSIGEAYSALAESKLFYDRNFVEAEQEIRRALELNPNDTKTHNLYGALLLATGRFAEALAARKRALEIDPVNPFMVNAVGWVYFYQRNYDDAIEWYRQALALDPNFTLAHQDLGNAYYQKGMHAEAIDEFLKSKTLSGASPQETEALRQVFHSSGASGYWQKELARATEQMQSGRVNSWRMARIYTELNNAEAAFAWLEKALAERSGLIIFLNVVPFFDRLHGDPRFADLARRVGLTP
ncbi:MAG: tetratricopeptide repeat protein [Acidobacteria bacterium]|nr:tetratricopeptide repeat protein [Acidobacteriota bacterium]